MATTYKTVLQDTVQTTVVEVYGLTENTCSQKALNQILKLYVKICRICVNVNGYNWKYINDYGNTCTVSSLFFQYLLLTYKL